MAIPGICLFVTIRRQRCAAHETCSYLLYQRHHQLCIDYPNNLFAEIAQSEM